MRKDNSRLRKWLLLFVAALLSAGSVLAQSPPIITTYAGGGPNNVPALNMGISYPHKVAIDAAGNLYVASEYANRVYKVTPSGIASVAAGNGSRGHYGDLGDGGPATEAVIGYPRAVAVDGAGNLYIPGNNTVRKVDSTGTITTIVGNGLNCAPSSDPCGDGGPATAARLDHPEAMVVDSAGNLYIAVGMTHRIRKVDTAGIITTVAGNGVPGYSGDGGLATSANLWGPVDVAVDSIGNLYIADTANFRIRKVDTSGIITTVAGTGIGGSCGGGGPAIAACLTYPRGVGLDSAGNLFIADTGNQRVRRVDAATGIITTVAGTGSAGYSGDGGPAIAAKMNWPEDVTADSAGNLFIADSYGHRIRKLDAAGIITTAVGNGTVCRSGDGGPATAAGLCLPQGLAVDSAGNVYVAEVVDGFLRKVDSSGTITTVAGNGAWGYAGDGGPATEATFYHMTGVAVDSAGNLYIADHNNHRIRKVDTAGIVATVAGNGTQGFDGDGGLATAASFFGPFDVQVDSAGNLFVADLYNNRVRKIDISGTVTTVAGDGTYGHSGDGGPATAAKLASPTGLAVDALGNVYVAVFGANRIRRIDALTGVITTVAGNGSWYGGDGGPATAAGIFSPWRVTLDSYANLYISEANGNRIRRVKAATGIINTVAGNGTKGYAGDDGPATAAQLNNPIGVAVDTEGNIYIADSENNRVRVVRGLRSDDTPPTIIPTVSGTLGNNGWYVSNVSVFWTVTDAESPVSSTSGCGTTQVISDTAGMTFTCTATSEGGTASQSVTVKRDANPPLVVIAQPKANYNLLLNELVTAIYSCTDAPAGVQSMSGTVPNGQSVNTATLGDKVFSVTCVDRAGNSSTLNRLYKVVSVSGGVGQLVDLVASLNLAHGIENSLDAKLQNAVKAMEASNAGRRNDAILHLEAFVNEVEAQRGKTITEEQADQLVDLANRIIAVLRG